MGTIELLRAALLSGLSGSFDDLCESHGELTLVVPSDCYHSVCSWLQKNDHFAFDMMIDLCGVDYLYFPGDSPGRFAVVLHLLSTKKNCRLRIRSFCAGDDRPLIASVVDIWPCSNWFEREAFDLFGIIFVGHPDLRRILTDYGFVGHPFRKDFPISGYLELSYDSCEERLSYKPVSIEPRVNVPRVIREENYGNLKGTVTND